jgi:tryptophan 2,3-dioxygenase
MPVDYSDYVRLRELLALQGGVERDERKLTNDEVLFVVVHQVDELWFKLALRELDHVRDVFAKPIVHESDVAPAARGLSRAVKVLELATEQFALMETMTPRDFLDFRAKLFPASGFQSPQFRELEIAMGLPAQMRLPLGSQKNFLKAIAPRAGVKEWARSKVEERLALLRRQPTLKDALEQWLRRTPIDGSAPSDRGDAAHVDAFLRAFLATHEREVAKTMKLAAAGGALDAAARRRFRAEVAAARDFLLVKERPKRRTRAAALFVETYRDLPLLAWPREVLDRAIQFEQAFLVFRQRHARMVERMIGRRVGTGGSAGVEYLDATASYRVFEELWQVRTLLVPRRANPPLTRRDFYEFKSAT